MKPYYNEKGDREGNRNRMDFGFHLYELGIEYQVHNWRVLLNTGFSYSGIFNAGVKYSFK